MLPLQSGVFKFNTEAKKSKVFYYDILLNGKPIGYIGSDEIDDLKNKLRYMKALGASDQADTNPLAQGVPKFLEICHIPKIELANCGYSLYPALYLYTSPGRMMRPVKNLTTNQTEHIGTMEQCYLHVCIKPEEFVENVRNVFNLR